VAGCGGLHAICHLASPPQTRQRMRAPLCNRSPQHRKKGGGGGVSLTIRMRISCLPTSRPSAFAKTPPIVVCVCW
jgi:hypothetical protein